MLGDNTSIMYIDWHTRVGNGSVDHHSLTHSPMQHQSQLLEFFALFIENQAMLLDFLNGLFATGNKYIELIILKTSQSIYQFINQAVNRSISQLVSLLDSQIVDHLIFLSKTAETK
jgi:hypothetical protein